VRPDAAAGGPTTVGSVYVHAPFCARRCVYCDFAVQVRSVGDTSGWLEALAGEMRAVQDEGLFGLATRLQTLYVGGGTPSLLGPDAMAGLVDLIGVERLSSPDLDWTAEANPESLTADVARGWRAAGVNRLSLGVQSFDADALRWMGRLHGSDGPGKAVAVARDAGIDDLSVDLIFGLPDGVRASWSADLDQALALDVPHVSLYGLTVESGTRLGRSVAEGREQPADEERYREEFLEAARVLSGEGYVQYEVSNFARPGHESRHNSVYWSGAPYLGLGNGAHSYAHPVRRWNERSWDAYAAECRAGRSPESDREFLDHDATRLEAYWLGLRTRGGLALSDLTQPRVDVVSGWSARGWAVTEGGRVRLTPEGWLLLDRLTVELAATPTG